MNTAKLYARRLGGLALRLGLLLLIALLLYALAALAGAYWPRNRDFVSATQGVRIWVYCSDIHTDVIVPVKNEVFDWTSLISPDDAIAVDPTSERLSLGWGDRKFFLETRTWNDVKLRNVASAFLGLDETAMHVEWLKGDIETGDNCRSLMLSPKQYSRLCLAISESFVTKDAGRAVRLAAAGYTKTDAFYEAKGRYSFIKTCNSWAGDVLADGGVKVGRWTPMTWGVMWQIPRDSEI